jgi:hypothetical protein
MIPFVLLLVALMAPPSAQSTEKTPQEKPKVPKDSIELTVIGCLKGRVLSTIEQRQADVESSPHVGERTFRVAAKKDVMEEFKKHNGQLVEVTGVVKRSALDDKGVKLGHVTVAPASPVGGRGIPDPAANVDTMDVWAVRMRSSSCTGG